MTVKVTGLNSNSSGSYGTNIDCGNDNGQIVSGPSGSRS